MGGCATDATGLTWSTEQVNGVATGVVEDVDASCVLFSQVVPSTTGTYNVTATVSTATASSAGIAVFASKSTAGQGGAAGGTSTVTAQAAVKGAVAGTSSVLGSAAPQGKAAGTSTVSGGGRAFRIATGSAAGTSTAGAIATGFATVRQAIINGLVSAQSEAHGWNADLKPNIPVGAVVRTSDTVVTITLPADATYDITASETITDTVPAIALVGGTDIVATPTMSVAPTGANITVALSGVAATFAIGVLGAAMALGVTGNAAAGQVGTVALTPAGIIQFDAAVAGYNGSTAGATFDTTFTVGTKANRAIVANVLGNASSPNGDVTGVTWDPSGANQAFTQVGIGRNGSGFYESLWLLLNPVSGTKTLRVFKNDWCAVTASAYSGAKQTSQPDSHADATGTGAHTVTGTTTVVAANCWLVMGGGGTNGGPLTAGAGSTLRAVDSGQETALVDSNGIVGTGAQSLVINAPSGGLAWNIISLAPATNDVTVAITGVQATGSVGTLSQPTSIVLVSSQTLWTNSATSLSFPAANHAPGDLLIVAFQYPASLRPAPTVSNTAGDTWNYGQGWVGSAFLSIKYPYAPIGHPTDVVTVSGLSGYCTVALYVLHSPRGRWFRDTWNDGDGDDSASATGLTLGSMGGIGGAVLDQFLLQIFEHDSGQLVAGPGLTAMTVDTVAGGSGYVATAYRILSPASAAITPSFTTMGAAGPCTINAMTWVEPEPSAPLTGVQGTGAAGTVTPSITIALTGVQATGAAGTVAPSRTVALTGAVGTGSVGTVAASQAGSAAASGVQGTGQVGTVLSSRTIALTGAAGAGNVGTVVPTIPRALTGVQATGQVSPPIPSTTVALTGVVATGQVGTVTASQAITIALTGVQATGAVGTVVPSQSTGAVLTGVAATGGAGTLAPSSTVALTGVSASGTAGNLATSGDQVTLSGVAATGQVGSVSASQTGSSTLSGVQAAGQVGNVAQSITITLTGVQASGQAGTLAPQTALTGVQGTTAVGTVVFTPARALAGVQATSAIGNLGTPNITIALTGVQVAGQVGFMQAGSNVTVAITGVQAVGAVGTVIQSASVALTGTSGATAVGFVSGGQKISGVQAAGAAGTLVQSASSALTGASASGQVGTPGPRSAVALPSGVQAIGLVGSPVATPTFGLTGVQASGAVGALPTTASRTLGGVSAAGQVGTPASSRVLALTGVQATSNVGTMFGHVGDVPPGRLLLPVVPLVVRTLGPAPLTQRTFAAVPLVARTFGPAPMITSAALLRKSDDADSL